MVAAAVLECDNEQITAELEELETPVETILGSGTAKRELKVDNEQLSLHDRIEMDSEKTRKGDKNYTLPKKFQKRDPYQALLSGPFSFYSQYVSMSVGERERFAESQAIAFYRSCACELEEKGRVIENEITIIKDLSLKYMTEGNSMKEKAKETE
jgi:hypothetical protein